MADSGMMEKIGPLPAIGWVGIAGVVFIGIRYIRSRQTAATTTSGTTIGVDPSLSADSGPVGDNFGAPPLAGSPGTSGIATNTQWATLASTTLINTGKWTPAEIETALWGYMNGQVLTGNGSAIINAALSQFGSPPEGNVATAGAGVNPVTAGAAGGTFPTFTNNSDWASHAEGVTTQEMTQQPKDYTALQMQAAIFKYINGQPLNALEQRIVNHVLVLAGPPPVPVAPPGAMGHLTTP